MFHVPNVKCLIKHGKDRSLALALRPAGLEPPLCGGPFAPALGITERLSLGRRGCADMTDMSKALKKKKKLSLIHI